MYLPFQKALIIAPHTDDGELGCGGTICRLLDEKKEVYYIAFSICEESVPSGFQRNVLDQEVRNATKTMGIPPDNLLIKNYPVRRFTEHRQDILEDLVILKKKLKPDLVFMPCSQSIHQDHIVIHNEGIRAFKNNTCLGYELPWDSINFSSSILISLGQNHLEGKLRGIEQYVSQQFRDYCSREFILSLAIVRGGQIGTKYAESFEAIRIVI